MFTVALVGADGAGKTTIGRALSRSLPFPAVYIYMGANLEASTVMLPSTWLIMVLRRWRRAPSGPTPPPSYAADHARSRGPLRRFLAAIKQTLRLGYLLLEETYRLAIASWHRRRGRVVIFDRHVFADYYASDVTAHPGRPFLRRLHGAVLTRYPRPDLTICLDAPAPVLWARKREGELAWVEQRRTDYLRLREVVPNFAIVDAAQPAAAVLDQVVAAISAHREKEWRARP